MHVRCSELEYLHFHDFDRTFPLQLVAKKFYASDQVQIAIAFAIFFNFITNAAQFEVNPQPGTVEYTFFNDIDLVFTQLFGAELLVNLFANWYAQHLIFCS